MPTPYTGSSVGVQSPSAAPAIAGSPIINLPALGDRGADIFSQALKACADWLAFLAGQSTSQAYGLLLRVTPLVGGVTLASITGCRRARVRMVGGGGGGGGSVTAGAGGGAAGGYCEWFTATVPVNWTYAIGAAGTAGTNAPTAGGAGGNTTFSDGVTTVTAFGGGGGGVAAQPGTPPAISTNGTINGSGEAGGAPIDQNVSGYGGSSLLGGVGGKATGNRNQPASGLPGVGPGAGGSGGFYAGTVSVAGGSGTAGLIILEEWS